MADFSLKGLRILVVEDEYLIADEIREALSEAGATVIGPVPTAEAAKALISEEACINAAILDINLRGTMVFDVADSLKDRDIPFLFATGYDRSAIPTRFDATPQIDKPIKINQIRHRLSDLIENSPLA